MRSASQAILKAGENPAFLGAKSGCVAILHTWGQSLTYHPHVHLLVPAGGFDSDLIEWVSSGKNFFAPVKVLSSLFRGIFAQNIYKLADKLLCVKKTVVKIKKYFHLNYFPKNIFICANLGYHRDNFGQLIRIMANKRPY